MVRYKLNSSTICPKKTIILTVDLFNCNTSIDDPEAQYESLNFESHEYTFGLPISLMVYFFPYFQNCL